MTQDLVPDWDDRLPWKKTVGSIVAAEVLRGSDDTELAVVLAQSPTKPTKGDVQGLWRARSQSRITPVLVAVVYPPSPSGSVCLMGLGEDAVPAFEVDRRMADQLITDALAMTSPSGLHAEVRRRLAALAQGLASGLRNEGLLASHVLEQQAGAAGWADLCAYSGSLLTRRREALMDGLGYSVEAVPDGTVLRDVAGGQRRAAAVLLADGESFENPLVRLQNTDAVRHGMAVARRENVGWVIVLGGPVVRLYPVDPDTGVGRKGQTQTYVELDLSLLREDESGYLALLFSAQALSHGGSLERLLADSSRYATALSERLRERVYDKVVPVLAVAVAERRGVKSIPADEQRDALDEAYHQAMIILFRLLFVAYAEDRGLLPYETSERYRRNALKTLAQDLLTNPQQVHDPDSTTLWDDLTQVWRVIDTGDLGGWGVPAYNGGLFTRDPDKNPSGAATYSLNLTNDVLGPVLTGLLIDVSRDGVLGPVDFRSLSVREFGTIYEGLLESGLGAAETDLALDANDTYIPARGADTTAVHAGEVYFHSRSGSRKATGSYFTKPFAVNHLLDTALEPAIGEHLTRVQRLLDAGATRSAAESLFDFRVADLSMGSAHFLVAAIDRIEARFSAFLIDNPLPEVAAELHMLRRTAGAQLGSAVEDYAIDDGALLRRQIARRCVYGMDINEIAVELARLGVWIHTFVPGLPLSFLNHGLVHGDSLTGVGTLLEVAEALRDAEVRELKRTDLEQVSSLEAALDGFLDRTRDRLASLGALADASVDDVALAGTLQAELEGDLAPLAALCDLITAERATRHHGVIRVVETRYDSRGNPKEVRKLLPDPRRILLSASPSLFAASSTEELETALLSHPRLNEARDIARTVSALHFPVAFPEVFRRDRPGFDCLLGNPPWEKLKVEEHVWWASRFPGLRSLSQQDKNSLLADLKVERTDLVDEFESDARRVKATANILAAGPYPGLRNATDTDLFAAFSWRFWHQLRDGGYTGVVLPRTALAGAGTEEWRKAVLRGGQFSDVTLLTNAGRWAFDMEPRYTIGLVSVAKRSGRHLVLRGPYASMHEYTTGCALGENSTPVLASTVLAWSDNASLPLVPSRDIPVFASMRLHPNLDAEVGDWQFQPLRELHTTDDKHFLDFNLEAPLPTHSLRVLTGASFNLWDPDFGRPYAYADPSVVVPFLQARRLKSARGKATAFIGEAAKDLGSAKSMPMFSPRIAFRDVARATDSRTMLCSLLPPNVALVHLAPYLLRQRGDQQDEAFLLGVLSSLPLDWYARRFVEQHMTYEHLRAFPIPRVCSTTGRLLDREGKAMGNSGDFRRIRDRVVEIAGTIAAKDARFRDWAQVVGVPVGGVPAAKQADLVAELDALVCLLYNLSAQQVAALFASFHRGWEYRPRLAVVEVKYQHWAADLARSEGSA